MMQPDSAPPPYDSYPAVHQYYPQSIAGGYYDGHVSPVVQQQPRTFVPEQTEYAAGNHPSGLQYLANVNQLVIRRECSFAGIRKYQVKSTYNQNLYTAREEGVCCCRSNLIKVVDCEGREVIHLQRDYECSCMFVPCICCCFLPAIRQKMEVYSPPGNLIGIVKQKLKLFSPGFDIVDGFNKIILKVRGSDEGICGIVNRTNFKLLSANDSVFLGNIWRQYNNRFRESFTGSAELGVSFSVELNADVKALSLSACILSKHPLEFGYIVFIVRLLNHLNNDR